MVLYMLSFFILSGAALFLLHLTPVQLLTGLTDLLQHRKKLTIAQQRQTLEKRKEVKGIRRLIRDCKATLATYNRSGQFAILTMLSFFLTLAGALIGSALENPFLVPVLAGCGGILPFVVVMGMSIKLKKDLNAELGNAVSSITSSYIRSDNLVAAVEENLDDLNSPVKEVFSGFLFRVKNVDADICAALEAMKGSFGSNIFADWVDELIICQDDRTLKSTLMGIVKEFSDECVIGGELNNMLYEPLKYYAIVVCLVIGGLIGIACKPDWGAFLVQTTQGQLMVAINIILILVSLISVIRSIQPLEYRR